MASRRHRRFWLFATARADSFRFIGAYYYGFVWGRTRRPVLALCIDDSWYDGSLSVSLVFLVLEAGVMIDSQPSQT